MKKLLLGTNVALLLLLFSTNAFAATNFSTVVGNPIKRQVIGPSTTVQSLPIDFTNVQGYAMQINMIDCTTCNTVISFFSSNDGINFVEVTGLTTVIDAVGSVLFNNINAFFKFIRVDYENADPVEDITVEVISTIKVGL